VVAPLVIGLGQLWRERPSAGELTTGLGLLAIMALVATHVARHPTDSWLSFSPGCVELPLLLWMAARYRPTFAIAAAFVLSTTVICATIFGIGHFGDASIPFTERVQGAQLTVAMITAFTLILVALFAERRQKEAALRLALDGAKLGAFNADFATGHFECDERAAWMHGHKAPPNTIRDVRRFIHRDDRKGINDALAKSPTTGGAWNAEYRVIPPPSHPHAGQTRWVAVESSVVCNSQGIPARVLGVT